MTRKLKALGLALVAVFALSAVAASSASAVDHKFMSENNVGNVTLHGSQAGVNKFFVTTGTEPVECEIAEFHGTQAKSPATTVTIHPHYTNCTWLSFTATVTVPPNCNYEFHGETPETNMALVTLNCEMGEPIKVKVPGCTAEIGDTHPANTAVNQALNGVKYTNIGSGTTREIRVDSTVHNIVSNVTGSFCALGGISTGTHTTGVYEGAVNVTGTVNGTHVGITIE